MAILVHVLLATQEKSARLISTNAHQCHVSTGAHVPTQSGLMCVHVQMDGAIQTVIKTVPLTQMNVLAHRVSMVRHA